MRGVKSSDTTEIGEEFTTTDKFEDKVEISVILAKTFEVNLKFRRKMGKELL
jgi:hypothetical protein